MSKIYQKIIPDGKIPAKGKLGGFTLIELLVVVLIIGILAAVALPQYRFMVLRAETARALPLLKSLRDAQDRYFMANGTYASKFDDLDIQMPPCKRKSIYQERSICEYLDKNEMEYEILETGPIYFRIGKDPVKERIQIAFNSSRGLAPRSCIASVVGGENSTANKLCQNIGGIFKSKGYGTCSGGRGCYYYEIP